MTAPVLRTDMQGKVWVALEKAKNGATAYELNKATGVPISSIQHMLGRWELMGQIKPGGKRDGKTGRSPTIYHAVSKTPQTFGPAEYRMWQSARGLGIFSAADIAAHASVEGGPVTQDDAHRYCRMLLTAGYVRVREKARAGERPARYMLIRNTGPRAPVKRRVTVFFDPNTSEVILPEDLR